MIFWGYHESVDILGGFITNPDYFGDDFYTFKDFFLRSRYKIGIFLGVAYFKISFNVCLILFFW